MEERLRKKMNEIWVEDEKYLNLAQTLALFLTLSSYFLPFSFFSSQNSWMELLFIEIFEPRVCWRFHEQLSPSIPVMTPLGDGGGF